MNPAGAAVPIFDAGANDGRRKRASETVYEYLTRSSSSKARWTRRVVEAKYARFPDPHGQLRGNLRPRPDANADVQFVAAATSLLIHDYFTRGRGWTCAVDEADRSGARRPDFIVTTGATEFALECTVVGPAAAQQANNRRARLVEDALNDRVELPKGFALGVTQLPLLGEPSYSRLANQINALVRELPGHEEALAALDAGEQLREFEVGNRGFSMTVRFVPLPVGRDLDSVVGVHFLPAEWVSPNIRVRDRILEKRASVLNVSAMSYVVAVVSTDPYCTEHDVRRGIYGNGSPNYRGYELDGVLDGGRNSRLSAVLWIPEWSITRRYLHRAVLYENANAAHPIDPSLLPWKRRVRPVESPAFANRGLGWFDREGEQRHPDDLR